MRDRRLLTLTKTTFALRRATCAKQIDTFLIAREESVLQKLVAIGGAAEEESFEVQVKARVTSDDTVLAGPRVARRSR